jgi:putative Mg2+ transporter-C (MgtC) family protein
VRSPPGNPPVAWGVDVTQDVTLLVRVAVAMGVGMLLGWERELAGKPAGLRTHMLVSGSACLLILLGDIIISEFYASEPASVIRTDPIRIFEAVVVGVSFLGAGTIWKSANEHRVEGLTTAASLLFAATLGIAVAVERYVLALLLALFAVALSRVLGMVEARLLRQRDEPTDPRHPG